MSAGYGPTDSSLCLWPVTKETLGGGEEGVGGGKIKMAESGTPEDDLSVPRAALNKMIKELLPAVRVSNDSRELILNCCTEFIHLVSSEANDMCNKSLKKTISPEHVLAALDSLGFGAYLEDCQSVLEECKTVAAKKKRASNRLENLGIPVEELLRQQEALFAKAREEQAAIEQQEWVQLQAAQQQQQQQQVLPQMPGVGQAQTAAATHVQPDAT